MPSQPFSISLRDAKSNEFDTLGRIHAVSFAEDPVVRALWCKADPEALRKWYWIDGAKHSVQQGDGTVIVAERDVIGDILGLAWFVKVTKSNPPSVPASFPEGYNVTESAKMRGPRLEWQNELLTKYGEYICERRCRWR